MTRGLNKKFPNCIYLLTLSVAQSTKEAKHDGHWQKPAPHSNNSARSLSTILIKVLFGFTRCFPRNPG